MGDEPLYRLPDEAAVPVSELTLAIKRLDDVVDELERRSERRLAGEVEVVIGLMTGWLWPLLRDLDDRGDH